MDPRRQKQTITEDQDGSENNATVKDCYMPNYIDGLNHWGKYFGLLIGPEEIRNSKCHGGTTSI